MLCFGAELCGLVALCVLVVLSDLSVLCVWAELSCLAEPCGMAALGWKNVPAIAAATARSKFGSTALEKDNLLAIGWDGFGARGCIIAGGIRLVLLRSCIWLCFLAEGLFSIPFVDCSPGQDETIHGHASAAPDQEIGSDQYNYYDKDYLQQFFQAHKLFTTEFQASTLGGKIKI
jgi:hypothetical protein